MSSHEMVVAIQRHAKHPRLVSIRLCELHLNKMVGEALIKLLQLYRHRSYETLEIYDCSQTAMLYELLRYVYHTQLFKKISMSAQPSRSHPSLLMSGSVRVEPPTSRFHFALQRLTLSNLYISIRNAVKLRKCLQTTKQLATLKLDRIQFERCAICQICQGIESNTTLSTLDCHWTSSADAYLMMHSVQGHSSIREIHFKGDCISDSGSVFIGKGLNSPSCELQTLRLTGLGVFDMAPMISEIQIAAPNSALGCRLTRLDLSDNLLQNYQIDYLFLQLHKFPALVELNLSRNRLSDFCEAVLSNPNVLSHSLLSLDLTYNRLTDHGADEVLSHLWKFPALQDLDLSRNRLHSLDFPQFFNNATNIIHKRNNETEGKEVEGQQQDRMMIQTYNLRRLALFHPHFSLLHPGEAVATLGWRNREGLSAFAPRLLWLLQRTPIHMKIGSFWASTNIETQHLLDIRQVSIDDPANVPVGLWPHMLSQANSLFTGDKPRQANAVFFLLHQGAPWFSSQSVSIVLPRRGDNRARIGGDEAGAAADGVGTTTVTATVAASAPKRNLSLEREILIGDDDPDKEQPSSEFMTCSMPESESTDNYSVRGSDYSSATAHQQHARSVGGRTKRYKRLLRMLRFGPRPSSDG